MTSENAGSPASCEANKPAEQFEEPGTSAPPAQAEGRRIDSNGVDWHRSADDLEETYPQTTWGMERKTRTGSTAVGRLRA